MAFGFAPTQDQIEVIKMVRRFVENEIVQVRAYYDERRSSPGR
jgi:hypothetical protein